MKTIKRLLALIAPYKRLIFLNIFSNIMVAVFTIASIPAFIPFLRLIFGMENNKVLNPVAFSLHPKYMLQHIKYQFAELIQTQSRETALLYICLLLVVLFFLKNLFRYLSLASIAPVRNAIVRDLRASLYEKYIELPLAFYDQQKKGDLVARITSDLTEVEWSILNVVESLFRQPLIILGGLGFMIYIHPLLSIIVIALVLFTGFIIGGIGRKLKKESHDAQNLQGELISHIHESLSGIKIIQSFNAQTIVKNIFDTLNNSYRKKINRILWKRDLSSPLSEFLGVCVFAILLWYGSKIVFSGQLNPETFFAFLIAFFYIIEPAKSYSTAHYHLTKGMAALDRIDTILQMDDKVNPSYPITSKNSFDDKIVFSNVSFKYNNSDRPAIHNLNFTIEKGQHVALVGRSGSGKSTIADLLSRFYEISSGQITIDGQDIRSINLSDLRHLIAIVTQEPILFHDTIENNIRFGRKNATSQDIRRVAKMAYAHDFISNTEDDYQTIIGDRGDRLSGGERQRIALARALLKDPPILVLDEATSALDSESENLIQKALQQALLDRTALIIAHRLSTIKACDKIIVVDQGKIIEQGTHDQLIQHRGAYYKFLILQQSMDG